MARIRYFAGGFDRRLGPALSGSHDLLLSWPELLWAAVTVGRGGWRDVIKHSRYSGFEMIYRASMLYANLRVSRRGWLRKTDAFTNLDRSEKSAVSYFIGLTGAKLVANRLFGIAWLLHLDVYRQLRPQLKGNQRPDLVGTDRSGRWVVFEAKGRSNGVDAKLIAKAKAQTRGLRKVCGVTPHLRVASAAYFKSRQLQLRLEDPDDFDQDSPDFDFPEDRVLEDYYDPFIDLLERSGRERTTEEVSGRVLEVVRLDEIDLAVGLDLSVREALAAPGDRRSRLVQTLPPADEPLQRLDTGGEPSGETSRESSEVEGSPDEPLSFLGPDGVLLRLGPTWSPEQMHLDPRRRRG